MRAFLLLISTLLLLMSTPLTVQATEAYTLEEVARHNSVESCWMVFEDKIYDLTNYIKSHDKYLDIRSWCGRDMTQDFRDKAGMGVDHKASTYSLLNVYEIGTLTLASASPTITTVSEEHSSDEEYSVELEGDVMKTLTIQQIADLWQIDANILLQEIIDTYNFRTPYTVESVLGDMRTEYKFSPAQIKDIAEGIKSGQQASITVPNSAVTVNSEASNPYNFWLPFLVSAGAYTISFIMMRKRMILRPHFNFFWNSVLLLSLIPSALFGFYLIFRYSIPALAQVDFDFMYWHVEGSIVMATIALAHLIQRTRLYLAPVAPKPVGRV